MEAGIANMSIKFKTFSIAVILTCTWLPFSSDKIENSILSTCFYAKQSLDDKSDAKVQCHPVYLANQSWLVWLTGGSHSAYFHFLDLVELLHIKK